VNSSRQPKAAMVPGSSITYGRLFTNPGKIICIGLNYKRHAAESKMKEPSQPILFNKYNNALAAANRTIRLPPKEIPYKFDYETELLIVIGKTARNVSEADAPNHIAAKWLRTQPEKGPPSTPDSGIADMNRAITRPRPHRTEPYCQIKDDVGKEAGFCHSGEEPQDVES
jgi:fumarylacetoacetase-like protein